MRELDRGSILRGAAIAVLPFVGLFDVGCFTTEARDRWPKFYDREEPFNLKEAGGIFLSDMTRTILLLGLIFEDPSTNEQARLTTAGCVVLLGVLESLVVSSRRWSYTRDAQHS